MGRGAANAWTEQRGTTVRRLDLIGAQTQPRAGRQGDIHRPWPAVISPRPDLHLERGLVDPMGRAVGSRLGPDALRLGAVVTTQENDKGTDERRLHSPSRIVTTPLGRTSIDFDSFLPFRSPTTT